MTDIEMTLDEIMRRQAMEGPVKGEPDRGFTEEEWGAFMTSPIWAWVVFHMDYELLKAQAERDSQGVTRDMERWYLGKQEGIRMVLNYPQQMMDNHKRKQTETEENQQ